MRPGDRIRHTLNREDEGVVMEDTSGSVCSECGISSLGTILVLWDGMPEPTYQKAEYIEKIGT